MGAKSHTKAAQVLAETTNETLMACFIEWKRMEGRGEKKKKNRREKKRKLLITMSIFGFYMRERKRKQQKD